MHVRDARAFTQLETVKEKILASEVFATEFRLDDPGLFTRPRDIAMPPGQTLDILLGHKAYGKLRSIVKRSTGLDIHPFRHLKPLILINLIDERMLSANMTHALDEALFHFAKAEGKELLGIETFQEQLSLMDRISLEDQLRALRSLGRNIRSHRRHLLRMTERYEKGDLRALYQSSRRGAHKLRGPLIYRRNERMAQRMGQILKEKTAVCAIGAAHLDGAKGVLRLLKKQGFKVAAT